MESKKPYLTLTQLIDIANNRRLDIYAAHDVERYLKIDAAIRAAFAEEEAPPVLIDYYSRQHRDPTKRDNDFVQVRQIKCGILDGEGLHFHITRTDVVWAFLPTAQHAHFDFRSAAIERHAGSIEEDRQVGFEAPFVLTNPHSVAERPAVFDHERIRLNAAGLGVARLFIGTRRVVDWSSGQLARDQFDRLLETLRIVNSSMKLRANA